MFTSYSNVTVYIDRYNFILKTTYIFVYIYAKSSSLFYQSGGKSFTWIGEKYLLILLPFY